MFALVLIFLTGKVGAVYYCSEILQRSDVSTWSTEDLKAMPQEEVTKCLSHLGKMKIPLEQAKIIWNSLLEYYNGPDGIPEEKLNSLHWITVAIEPHQYSNITLSSIDVIENFGLFYDLSQSQLSAIAQRVRDDWGDKQPEDYTSYDLMALRQIICAFDPSEIERIHAEAYKDAAATLGALKNCPSEVLESLAKLAVDDKAFGDPENWNAGTLTTVGVVLDGLPADMWRKIPEKFIAKTKEQIGKLNKKHY